MLMLITWCLCFVTLNNYILVNFVTLIFSRTLSLFAYLSWVNRDVTIYIYIYIYIYISRTTITQDVHTQIPGSASGGQSSVQRAVEVGSCVAPSFVRGCI